MFRNIRRIANAAEQQASLASAVHYKLIELLSEQQRTNRLLADIHRGIAALPSREEAIRIATVVSTLGGEASVRVLDTVVRQRLAEREPTPPGPTPPAQSESAGPRAPASSAHPPGSSATPSGSPAAAPSDPLSPNNLPLTVAVAAAIMSQPSAPVDSPPAASPSVDPSPSFDAGSAI